tara:strand:- start:10900 stop:12342 length:1443 start_codon:yes stop_codon:yes gene_type:complete
MPILEGVFPRQVASAEIAKNIYLDGEWLRPKIDALPGPRLLLAEFPLYHGLVAMVNKVIGFPLEIAGRMVTVISFVLTGLIMFILANRYVGTEVALASLFFYGTSPLGIIYGKAFQVDMFMVLISVASIYLWDLWLDKKEAKYFIFAIIFIGITPLNKFTGLSILLPILFLSYEKFGNRFLYKPSVISMLFASILPLILWINYIYSLKSQMTPISAHGLDAGIWIQLNPFFSYSYYKQLYEMVVGVVLTPIGFCLAIIGVAVRLNNRKDLFWHVWLLSTLSQFVLLNTKFAVHWFLLSLPVFSVFMGKGLVLLINNIPKSKTYIFNRSSMVFGFLFYLAIVIGYSNSAYKIPEGVKNIVEIGNAVKSISNENDIIVTDYAGWKGAYFSGRLGYSMTYGKEKILRYLSRMKKYSNEPEMAMVKPDPVSLLEYFRKKGAKYFSCSKCFKPSFPREFYKYLVSNYNVVVEKKGIYKIFDLFAE